MISGVDKSLKWAGQKIINLLQRYEPMRLLFLILLIFYGKLTLQAQSSTTTPVFSPFKGTAYKMPVVEKKRGKLISKGIEERFVPQYKDYRVLAEIEMNGLDIPETSIGQYRFPGLEEDLAFCMMLSSQLVIGEKACYEFSLNSDDGSILWLNEQRLIDNDGGHKMQMKKDSIILDKGVYKVRLWYFQGMPDRYGLQLDTRHLGPPDFCSGKTLSPPAPVNIESRLLFDTGAYNLKQGASQILQELLRGIDMQIVQSIQIIGHTDNRGDIASNLLLSERRALAVKEALLQFTVLPSDIIQCIGKGESMPIANNSEASGRAQNRRVEIIFN